MPSSDALAWVERQRFVASIIAPFSDRYRASVLMLDVIAAAERRRQAEGEYHRMFPEAADLIARGELYPFTDLAVDDALAALWAHVLPEAP